jgi:hypothetical protein
MIADNQDRQFKHKELTAKIIESFYNKPGYGFFEGVEVGFLFGFGPEPEVNPAIGGEGKHLIFTERKLEKS